MRPVLGFISYLFWTFLFWSISLSLFGGRDKNLFKCSQRDSCCQVAISFIFSDPWKHCSLEVQALIGSDKCSGGGRSSWSLFVIEHLDFFSDPNENKKILRRIQAQCVTKSLTGGGRFAVYKHALPAAIPDQLAVLHCRHQPASAPSGPWIPKQKPASHVWVVSLSLTSVDNEN